MYYALIILITSATAFIGAKFTSVGIDSGWYAQLAKPSWTPAGSFIGTIWTILYILTTLSALLVFNKMPHDKKFRFIMATFVGNAILNVAWSYIFFVQHKLFWATGEAVLLGLSVVLLIILIRPRLEKAAYLLIPYAVWVFFASYLAYTIAQLNT